MEHKTFGKIVAALRKEQINFTNGNRWNQTDLAEETGLTPSLVSRIERGQQARLDGEILTQLARAFNLTSLERRDFFAMASEVTNKEVVRADLCNEEVFEQVWALPVTYTVFTNTSLSSYGDLYLSTLIPQDHVTAELFRDLADKDRHALSLTTWPNPGLI